ncbi:MAG: hypothetical protein Tsb0014_06570 [Pleurocapsa sp.]
MKKFIQFIKSIKLSQILTVFLASSLLIISTACSQGNIAQAGGKAYTDTAKRAMSDTYDDYDANQRFVGGMNGYNDDRRYDAELKSKTKALVDNAEHRQQKDLGDYVSDLGDRAQETKDEAVENIQQQASNLKENASKTSEQAQKAFDKATDTAQNVAEDAAQATRNRAQDLKDNVQDLT